MHVLEHQEGQGVSLEASSDNLPIVGDVPGIFGRDCLNVDSGEAFAPSEARLERKEYFWKVVSYVPADILYAGTESLGFSVVAVAGDTLQVEIYEIDADEASTSYYDNPDALDDLFWSTSYTVQDGELTPGE